MVRQQRARTGGRRWRVQSDSRGDSPRRFGERQSAAEELPHVHPDHSLSLALERMGTSGLNVLPVVSRANVRQLMGIIALDDILDAYGVAKRSSTMEPQRIMANALRRTIVPGNLRVGLPCNRGALCGRYVSRQDGAGGERWSRRHVCSSKGRLDATRRRTPRRSSGSRTPSRLSATIATICGHWRRRSWRREGLPTPNRL